MKRSLASRLLIGTSSAMAVVLILLGLGIYLSIHRALLTEFDNGLRARAQALIGITEQHGGEIRFEFDPLQMPEYARGRHTEFFQFWHADGSTLARSPSLGKDGNLGTVKPTPGENAVDIALPDGRRGRAMVFEFVPAIDTDVPNPTGVPTNEQIVLMVTRDTHSLELALARFRYWLAALCGTAMLVSGVVLVVVVRRSLAPVIRLSERIESMCETDLSRRLNPENVPPELLPVVERLNGLLSRLEDAFKRERSFTGDVAHELRTPLAGLQATIETCRARRRDVTEYETALDRCGDIIRKMATVVQSLLLMARSESGGLTAHITTIDLADWLEDAWEPDLQTRAADRGITVHWDLAKPCLVEVDEDLLKIVLRNLMENALQYVDTGGSVSIRTLPADGQVILEIVNTGSTLGSEDMSHVFDRFWRGDAARHDAGMHSGIGLSLCRRLLSLIDGTIHAENRPGGLFAVQVHLNRSPQQPDLRTNSANPLEGAATR